MSNVDVDGMEYGARRRRSSFVFNFYLSMGGAAALVELKWREKILLIPTLDPLTNRQNGRRADDGGCEMRGE